MNTSLADRLAVCSWSLQPPDPGTLIRQLGEIGIPRVQIALDPIRELPAWHDAPQMLAEAGITCVSGMMTAIGEDYTTMDSIRLTGGVVPDRTWDGNWANFQANVEIAAVMGLKLVTIHAGFVPEDEADPAFAKVLGRILCTADLFASKGLTLGFETGQESAATLAEFLRRLDRPNVGVNFDPANLLLYQKGDPIKALRLLGPWLRQCHLKDAIATRKPGVWGAEVVIGTGDVDWRAFFQVLEEIRFAGDLCIEREFGGERMADIRAGAEFVTGITQ